MWEDGDREDEGSLHEEGPHRMLEGGDRAWDVGEGGLEMGEDLRCRSIGRPFGGRAARGQCGADLALAQVEAFPDAQPGPVAQLAAGGADGIDDAVGDGAFEELPQSAGGQAEASNFVGDPDAESPAATGTCVAIAAKDAPRPHRRSLAA